MTAGALKVLGSVLVRWEGIEGGIRTVDGLLKKMNIEHSSSKIRMIPAYLFVKNSLI
jgi:hypothetical protein